MNHELHSSNPDGPISEDISALTMVPWIKRDCKSTINLPQFENKPKQGSLFQSDEDNEWYIIPGRKKSNTPIHLANFAQKSVLMYHNKKLFKGWVDTNQATIAR